jgi:6-phosphogluconolactonase
MDASAGCAEVAAGLEGEMPISLLMLGMGEDMHTASLFPGAKGLAAALDEGAPLLCPIQPDGQDIARVTLPAHALQGAMEKHLVIYGAAKRKALDRALHLPPEEAPIAAVLDDLHVHWAA